jgi:hypothetical protein
MENERAVDHLVALVNTDVSETELGTVECAGAEIYYSDGKSEMIPGTGYPSVPGIFHSAADVVAFLAKKTGHPADLFEVEEF